MWNYGKEIWCNMEGRYLHVVADYSHESQTEYSISICSVGVFGTKYIRNTALETEIKIVADTVKNLEVPRIQSQFTIGNELNINLRQKPGSEVSWAQIIQTSPTLVKIDTTGIKAGNYTLTLESFDLNGSVYSTLRTDEIKIEVTAPG